MGCTPISDAFADANGNVTEYFDENGTVNAHYEYSATGEEVYSSGVMADDFTHRFSTKPFDPETGFAQYEQRPYDPVFNRFLSRDPIEENGGNNLYGFVGNDSENGIDLMGLCEENDIVLGWAIDDMNSLKSQLTPSVFWNLTSGNNLVTAAEKTMLSIARKNRFRKLVNSDNDGSVKIYNGLVFLKESELYPSTVHELIHYDRLQSKEC